MQKNKFVYEDINAVCNRAAKKLVAMGLAVAVGGTCTIGGSCNRVVSAQTPEETERRIDAALDLPVHTAQANRERDRQMLLTNPSEIGNFEVFIDGEIEARARDARAREARAREAIETIARAREAIARAREAREAIAPQPAQQNDLGASQMIRARGNQHIEAGPNTHVHSFSNNELTHEGEGEAKITGPGSVDIDVGDVTVSECDESLSRNVKVNRANSLTVAPGISTHIQDGTTFTIGHTAQETLENLQRAMGLPLGRERNAQALNFIISVIVALWSFSLGSLFGGSGGCQ